MPGQRRGEWLRCVLDVNDSAVDRMCGGTRTMKEKRTKREECTLRGQANGFWQLRAQLVDLRSGETTEAMRSIEHANRAIVFAAGIQTETDREHVLEHIDRWLNVRHTGFVRPGAIAR